MRGVAFCNLLDVLVAGQLVGITHQHWVPWPYKQAMVDGACRWANGYVDPMKGGPATPIFLRTGSVGWPSPPDELTQLNLPWMVGQPMNWVQHVLWVSWWISPRNGLGPMSSGAEVNNMTPGIMSTGQGLILVPPFSLTPFLWQTYLFPVSGHNLQPG